MRWKRISCVLHNQMKYQVVCVKLKLESDQIGYCTAFERG